MNLNKMVTTLLQIVSLRLDIAHLRVEFTKIDSGEIIAVHQMTRESVSTLLALQANSGSSVMSTMAIFVLHDMGINDTRVKLEDLVRTSSKSIEDDVPLAMKYMAKEGTTYESPKPTTFPKKLRTLRGEALHKARIACITFATGLKVFRDGSCVQFISNATGDEVLSLKPTAEEFNRLENMNPDNVLFNMSYFFKSMFNRKVPNLDTLLDLCWSELDSGDRLKIYNSINEDQ